MWFWNIVRTFVLSHLDPTAIEHVPIPSNVLFAAHSSVRWVHPMVLLVMLEDDDDATAPKDAEDIIDEEFNVTVFFIALIPLLWASLGQSTHFDSTGLSFVATYGKLLVNPRDLSLLQ